MNAQPIQKREWKQIAEELKTAIHNLKIQLELMQTQLDRAEAEAAKQKD